MDSKVPSAPPAMNPDYKGASQDGVPLAYAVPVNNEPKVVVAEVVTTQTPPLPPPVELGRKPVRMECPFCKQNMVTRTKKRLGACTAGSMAGLVLCCCWICAIFPLCCGSCKDTIHYCSSCGREIGEKTAACC
mmetsp:Transcript_26306/g.37704  ORF Transcript_26306/g.37704 Transcript_26306/m.37704 type:complete len:133 (+) Transcript_26306:116-514(+)